MTVPTYAAVSDARGNPATRPCAHIETIAEVTPSTTEGCEDCLREGTRWVHLRECLVCGHVGCCDNSPRRHATAHWHGTAHAIVRSIEPGEEWAWCYPDELFLEPV
jgi:CPA1 family monovalent cation:H+ antiporter